MSHLVHTNVAFVTKDHVIAFLAVRRATHITYDVLIVLYSQALLCLNGVVHVIMALPLQGLHHPLHCQLIQRPIT